jgi:uncharacterized membrane protein
MAPTTLPMAAPTAMPDNPPAMPTAAPAATPAEAPEATALIEPGAISSVESDFFFIGCLEGFLNFPVIYIPTSSILPSLNQHQNQEKVPQGRQEPKTRESVRALRTQGWRNNMELWHWHPIFVHFTVALLFTGSALFIVYAGARNSPWAPKCLTAAQWMFWFGIAAALFTAATGLLASFTVPNIDANTRDAINDHFMSAAATAILYLILAFFLWRRQSRNLPPGNGWTIILVIAMILLVNTAYLGGNLVFMRGVGVAALH